MKRVLQWSAPPAALAFSQPHVLAMLPSSIEARLRLTVPIAPSERQPPQILCDMQTYFTLHPHCLHHATRRP